LLNLSEIREKIEFLASKLNADRTILPTYGYSSDSGRPHIEVNERGYHFIVKERGNEWERLTADDIGLLMYRVFKSITNKLASDYEFVHRISGQRLPSYPI
jgi:Immunity protein 63